MTTFAAILDRQQRAEPGRPLVTYYDLDSGERTELSVVTYATWVAKVASLLAEELDIEQESRIRVDLPPHWLGPIVLGAAWTLGAEVITEGEAADADLVVTGGSRLEGWLDAGSPILASALHPLGTRFPEPPPSGVLDLGVEVWGQPDAFSPWQQVDGSDAALDGRSQDDLWSEAEGLLSAGARLLSTANPCSEAGRTTWTAPLVAGGSLVLVANPDQDRLASLAETERVTDRW